MNTQTSFRFHSKMIVFLTLLLGSISATAQVVNIPDPNFKAALVADAAINTNGDAEIQLSEAKAYTGVVRVNNLDIASLTGIEAFTAIKGLNCSYNQLTALDLSANIQLTEVRCDHNSLNALDVSANTALTSLECFSNQLTSLSVATNASITSLKCFNNQLTRLDLGEISSLVDLRCNHNLLTSLDLGSNNLKTLYVYNNQLTTLDVTGSTQLTDLSCHVNKLTALDLEENMLLKNLNCSSNSLLRLSLTGQLQLQTLFCQSNLLSIVDLSNQVALTTIDLAGNNLIYLNIKNGHNTQLASYNTTNNPHLKCIQVDNPPYSAGNWLQVDEVSSFETYCDTNYLDIVNFVDPMFKAGLFKNHAIDLNGDNEIQVSEAALYTGSISVRFAQVQDITGIASFPLLRGLIVDHNLIETMDLSANKELEHLDFSDNDVSTLDLSNNPKLTFLSFGRNKLSTLKVTDKPALRELNCDSNKLTSLDLTKNPLLSTLSVSHNFLTSIDISKNTLIKKVTVLNNELTSLDVHSNTSLVWLYCSENLIANLDIKTNSLLVDLFCDHNQLTSLNLQNGANWKFNRMDVRSNPELICIQVNDIAYAVANFTDRVDPGVAFSRNCNDANSPLAVKDLIVLRKIYPNPFSDKVSVTLGGRQTKPSILVYDMLGRSYESGHVALAEDEATIDLSNLRSGFYILQVDQQKYRIVKE